MNTRNEVSYPRRYGSPLVRRTGLLLMGLFVLFVFAFLAAAAYGGEPDQAARWQTAKVNPAQTVALDKLVDRWRRTAATYREVQAMCPNGVPAAVAFCLFYREADNNMACSPAQGDPLTHLSRNVPSGRIPGKRPPFLWKDAAFDAYYVCDHLDKWDWRTAATALAAMESFNGTGYARFHTDVPTPYLWAGTTLYQRGKYVADGRFDCFAVDKQIGAAAILLRMRDRGNFPTVLKI
ncbi:MAG: hypothetical protein INR62_02720 [Rhodospirillales bacterium]|nr:hypothetical protein [Acetobacter sp.]